MRERGVTVWLEMEQRSRDTERQDREAEIRKSKYAKEISEIVGEGGRGYLEWHGVKKRGLLERMGRFRLGNESWAARNWMEGEDRMCRMCGKELETQEHVIENCEISEKKDLDWREVIRKNGRYLDRLHEIVGKRKRMMNDK